MFPVIYVEYMYSHIIQASDVICGIYVCVHVIYKCGSIFVSGTCMVIIGEVDVAVPLLIGTCM